MYKPVLGIYQLYHTLTLKITYEINSLLLCSRFPDRLSQPRDNKLQRNTVQQLKKAGFRGSTSCPDMKYPTSKNLISVGYFKLHIRTEMLMYATFENPNISCLAPQIPCHMFSRTAWERMKDFRLELPNFY